MNLIKALQKDLSKKTCDQIVRYIGSDKTRFSALVNAFLNSPIRITQRAGGPLSYCAKAHPELIKPHLKKIILNLKKPNLHDGIKRNTVRLLQFVKIPKPLQAHVLEICFTYLEDAKQPVAIRVFSMTVLANLSQEHPDLKPELIALIEGQMPYGSAGFVSRGRKVLKSLLK